MNRFEFDEAGNLQHFLDDELRATVKAEHVDDYRAEVPECPEPVPAIPPTGN